jgi:PAS domain S-box-containing protein/putative nucleotidyltransferase with HDIG domain
LESNEDQMEDNTSKILIIDDDPQFRRTLSDVVQSSGYATTALGAPEEAVRAATKESPSVAIIDLKLEDASGLEVMRQIKKNSPYTECIILTGYASQESAIAAVNVGAYSYVQKPYDLDQLLITIRHASERAEAGRALRESEEKYRLVVDGASEGIVLLDLHGTIQEVNPKALELSALERDDLVGKNFVQLLPSLKLDPADTLRAFKDMLTGNHLAEHEWTVTNWQGNQITFILHHSLVKKAGHVVGVSIILEDVTDRKRAESELRESELKYRRLVEHSLQGMLVAQGMPPRIVFANAALAHIAGYTVEELLALLPEETSSLVHPEDRDFFFEQYRHRLAGTSSAPGYEFRALRKDGTTRWLELHASPITYDGQPAVQAVFVDITDRKRAQEELIQSYEQVQKSLEGTINALATAVEKRDPYTAGHQHGVAKLAVAVSREMGLSQDQISGIRVAGLIHDIGKIYVPSEILSKPSKLSDIEMTMIRTHPEAGYDVLRTVDFPWPVAEIVLQHHERLDGSGYPRALSGEEICLDARILAVADVVEAMVSHRPYRPAHPQEAALDEILRNKGILYDPAVVEATVKVLTEKEYHLGDATDAWRDDGTSR